MIHKLMLDRRTLKERRRTTGIDESELKTMKGKAKANAIKMATPAVEQRKSDDRRVDAPPEDLHLFSSSDDLLVYLSEVSSLDSFCIDDTCIDEEGNIASVTYSFVTEEEVEDVEV